MTKILWVKFGWSEFYRGGPVDGNFSYLAGKRKLGHEAYNFAPAANGTYYCYVPPQIKVHAPTHPDRTGWTVVCLAKHPKRKGVHIVGWYEDATLLGRWRDVPDTRARPPLADTDQGECWSYCITSKSAYFVPPQERNITFSHPSVRQGKFSFLAGPGVVATPNKNQVRKYLKHRLKKLKSVVIENPTDETAPDPGTDPADPLGGFGTPEHRKKVEKAAEKAVKRHYNAKGFSYVDVTKENPWVRFHLHKGTDRTPRRSKGHLRRTRSLLHDPQRKYLSGTPGLEVCNRHKGLELQTNDSRLRQSAVQQGIPAHPVCVYRRADCQTGEYLIVCTPECSKLTANSRMPPRPSSRSSAASLAIPASNPPRATRSTHGGHGRDRRRSSAGERPGNRRVPSPVAPGADARAPIGRVSGQGLFCIVDVVEDRDTKRPHPKLAARIQNAMRDGGVLVGLEVGHDSFLKIRPPMPFGPAYADLLIQALERALTVHGRR